MKHVLRRFLPAVLLVLTGTIAMAGNPFYSNRPPMLCLSTGFCPTCPVAGIANGCIFVSLDLGETTPWTGSIPVFLRIHTIEESPSLSTPSPLKVVMGYTFKNVGDGTTRDGAPAVVRFVDPDGTELVVDFKDGESLGVPRPTVSGKSIARVRMVDAEGWAALSNPAYYDLYPGDGSVWRFLAAGATNERGALVSCTDPRGRVLAMDDFGVDIVRDALGNIRQVKTLTRLADVQTLSPTHYAVTVYPLAEEPEQVAGTGLYALPEHAPVRVLDVARGESVKELLVGLKKGTGDVRQYRFVAANGDWTLEKPDGLRDSKELYYSEDESGARRIQTVRGPDGTLLSRTEGNYVSAFWAYLPTNLVEGVPGDATRTTSWSYYADGPHKDLVREKTEPNGNRIVYEYDAQNRVVRESMPLVEEETLYSYEPVDPSDPPLLCDTRPRCVVKKMQGVEIRRTYYVYGTNGVDVVERVGEPGAAYGGTNVLRTVTTYYPVTGSVVDGLVQSVRHEDGTVDHHAYDLTDGIWTETITHVHEQAPAIVPMRTTRSVRVYNALGQLVDSRTDLCTIGVEDLVPQADWTPIERLQYAYDADGNEIRREDLAGRLWTAEWAGNCCGKVSETDWQGITTTYAYDAEGRVVSSQEGSILTELFYDDLGRITNVVRRGVATADRPAATVHPATYAYDSLGRLKIAEGENGIHRVYSYTYRPEGGETRTITEAPSTDCERTNVSISDAIGRTIREFRNGTLRRSFAYAPFLETVYEGSKGTNSPVWTARERDLLGRVVQTRQPGFDGSVLRSRKVYDSLNRIVETDNDYTLLSPGSVPVVTNRRLSTFDAFGNLVLSVEDANRNGQIDLASSDVVVSNTVGYVVRDGLLWRESARHTFPDTNSSDPLRVSTSRIRLTGLGGAETTELGLANIVTDAQTVDAFGSVASRRSFVDRLSSRFLTVNDSAFSALSAWNLEMGGFNVSNRTVTGILSSRAYDALGRVIAQTDGRGNTTTLAYDTAGRLASTTDATGATTAYGYDSLGRQTSVTNALGLVTTTAYDLDGNVVSQRGAQYPVDYAYDDYGRMAAMSTYRSEDLSHADVTTWLYDEATGLMTNKIYADGKGPTYDYTPEGRLSRRTWARGVTTDYAYDSQGRLVAKTYSDSTPAVSLSYDRHGHTLSAVCVGVSTNLYAYNRLGQLTNEVQNGTTIARTYDALGRATGYAIGDGVAAGSAVSYSYDPLGRFASVSSGTNVFSYSYLPGSSLVSGMAANTDHAWERIYEPDRDLIATVHNRYGDRTISRFDYTNDEIRRRDARVDYGEAFAEPAFERYAYNDRSELVSAQRFSGADTNNQVSTVPNRSWSFAYDPIGNRVFSAEDRDGQQPVITCYESNELNQYISTEKTGSNNAFEYDADGNLTFDGCFHYYWNGENRVVRAENDTISNNLDFISIDYAYDERGRMISEFTYGTNTHSRVLLWDEYNIVRELENAKPVFNIWGLDVNGLFQGMGGIGGLTATYSHCNMYVPFYDANGNIVDYLDGDANNVAHYEYSPYGTIDNSSGNLANRISHNFSTKLANPIIGLTEFEFRSYNPDLGAWLNRDPSSEWGWFSEQSREFQREIARHKNIDLVFPVRDNNQETVRDVFTLFSFQKTFDVNAYLFAANAPINKYDFLGLFPCCPADRLQCQASCTATYPDVIRVDCSWYPLFSVRCDCWCKWEVDFCSTSSFLGFTTTDCIYKNPRIARTIVRSSNWGPLPAIIPGPCR